MRLLPLVLLTAAAAPAYADQTFKAGDYEIVATDRSIDVRKGARRTTLISGYTMEVSAKADTRAKKVTVKYSKECHPEFSEDFTFDQLEARLINHESVSLHLKKDWTGSAKGFAQVAKLDPTWILGAYNLASALTRLGKLDDANAALASRFASAPLATYIQVSIDPDLQPLLATKAVKAVLGSTKPGTLKIGERGLRDEYAYSADRGWLAVHHSDDGYVSCDGHAAITIFDVKTNKTLGTIDLGPFPTWGTGAPEMCQQPGRAALDKAKQARLAKTATAEKILGAFGFTRVPGEKGPVTIDNDTGKRSARLPTAKLGVVLSDSTNRINVLRGNTSLVSAPFPVSGRLSGVAYVPDAHALVVSGYVPSDLCSRTDEGVIVIPDAPAKK